MPTSDRPKELAARLNELERTVINQDGHIKALFQAVRELMAPPEPKKRRIGFLVRSAQRGTEEGRAVISTFSEFRKCGSVLGRCLSKSSSDFHFDVSRILETSKCHLQGVHFDVLRIIKT
jgi:hypothetical protein